ncbi:MAG: arsenate reductase (glutaredoxin) [Weeksellaceae bacterium]
MLKIYHNPRCSKSREGLKFLEDKGLPFEVVKYMDKGITKGELESIVERLGYNNPIELVRTNEDIWKENYKDKKLTDDQIIEIMVENPKLIQRPIVINGLKAVVGRPTEKIEEVL